jgi:hypothetical protein
MGSTTKLQKSKIPMVYRFIFLKENLRLMKVLVLFWMARI